uniref:Movement protein n=1 Tax=Bursaphelenchus xylophilus TaxID=6326 RepID=A0A1I7SIY0_BURXY
MAKVEVQIRHCFCCGLHIGSFFVAIYSLLVFLLLGTLALWGLSDLTQNGDKIYDDCEKEALGVIRTGGLRSTSSYFIKQ